MTYTMDDGAIQELLDFEAPDPEIPNKDEIMFHLREARRLMNDGIPDLAANLRLSVERITAANRETRDRMNDALNRRAQ